MFQKFGFVWISVAFRQAQKAHVIVLTTHHVVVGRQSSDVMASVVIAVIVGTMPIMATIVVLFCSIH